MKLPKSFRPEKDLDSKIEDFLDSESLVYDPRVVAALLDISEEFLEQACDDYDGFYDIGVGLVRGLKYGLKDVEELSKRIKYGQSKLLGIYLSVLVNKKIKEKDTVTFTLEEELDSVGLYLQKGTLIIKGNTNNNTGFYMEGGKIVVKGNVNNFTGFYMVGGGLVVEGNANDFTGCYMGRGELIVEGNANGFTGSGMEGGRLVVEGEIRGISDYFSKGAIIEGDKVRRDC
ncbi:MAG: hypothetical protein KKA79_01195 [Nanoarchaeota archaeon]|nr:hypothetical protein [Nanoarchaeota archaeon]